MASRSVTIKKFLIRNAAPVVRRQMLALAEQAQDLTSQAKQSLALMGSLPDFIIIGTQKGGTTYLYDELMKQPGFVGARTKEIHFYDSYYHRGAGWYRAFFPRKAARRGAGPVLAGEASPSYLFHPHAARRASVVTPKAKFIVLLRNPVERAYSHYHHEVRLGYEHLSFAEAIEQEAQRLAGELERMQADDTYTSHAYMHFSYLARGRYLEQLRTWHCYFSKEQILVLTTEQLQKDTPGTIGRVGAFLGLRNWTPVQSITPKIFPYPRLEADVRQRLTDYFAPYNQALFDYVGADYGWNG
jgi:hypothetical protein